MNALTQSAKHLIPEYWNIKWVETTEDLVFLGKVTVRQLVRYWRRKADSLAGQIKYTQEMIDLLKGKTGKDLVEQQPEWSAKTQRRFNTLCFLSNLDAKDVEFFLKALEGQKAKLIEKKKKVDIDIKLLLGLERRAEEKPALPSERPYDWFDLNDKVVCFIGNWKERIYQDVWATGKVIDGYRHQDGCVSVNYDEKIHNGPYLEGHGVGYGMARPEVMLLWEYHYLRQHPDFAKLWVQTADKHLVGFKPEEMLDALTLKGLPAPTN